jgi:PucR C-terminal helix-turn-helix domain
VTDSLLASNVSGVERSAQALPASRAVASGDAASWLLPVLGELADDITSAVTREVAEYADPGDEAAVRAVRRVARDAVAGFGARVAAAPLEPGAEPAAMFRDLGRLLAMEGRSLSALRAALRVGARVTWQHLQEQARMGHGNPEAFTRIGEAVYWYMDELAASCSAGYAEGQAELAGETSQLRRHLLELLTASPAAPLSAIANLARAAGWPLPRRVAAVALAPLSASQLGPLPSGVLADLTRRDPCLLVVDPDGPDRRRQLAAALHGWLAAGQLAAVGPAVPLAGAGGSLRWAGQALTLARRGHLRAANGGGIIWCEDHLPTLVLLADADLAATLCADALAPLRQLRPDQAERLARTLLAWLESADEASAAARRLHVHPQTIRYRLRQASELFGDALADPEGRFRLLLALRIERLLDG